MPRMLVTLDGAPLKEVPLAKERTRIGRRPYNDIVIDHLAVSGEHAIFIATPEGAVEVEDLDSTNGTFVNGQRVQQRQRLQPGDLVEMGRYQLRLLPDGQGEAHEKTVPAPVSAQLAPPPPPPRAPALQGAVRVASGPAAGREMGLVKVVTTFGRPGVAVASITRRPHGFVLAHVEGAQGPLLNGAGIGDGAVTLRHGDRIALVGTEMEFVQG